MVLKRRYSIITAPHHKFTSVTNFQTLFDVEQRKALLPPMPWKVQKQGPVVHGPPRALWTRSMDHDHEKMDGSMHGPTYMDWVHGPLIFTSPKAST